MRRNNFVSCSIALAMLWVASGCAKEATELKKTESAQPVTLTVFQQAEISDDDFKLLFADPVKKKYPHITLQLIRSNTAKLEDLIVSGKVPDILTPPNADILSLSQKDILFDISPLIKQNKIDLNRFEQVTIDAIKSDKGELWGLPYAMQFNTLYYNKDIFNRFGVAPPKDGMTWEDAIELAKKLTRNENGIQYRGLDVVSSYLMSFPFGLAYVDGKSNKASINNDQWKRVFELTKQIQTIPGNETPKPEPGAATQGNLFVKDKNIAMLASTNLMAQIGNVTEAGVNWDIAQYPSYKEKLNISGKLDTHNLAISKTSGHKDDAIKVLEVLTSDEVQLLSVRKTARKSPLKNAEMEKQYGADLPYLKGKNIAAIFKSKVAPAPVYSTFELDGKKIGQAKFKDYLEGKIDINTALRQADEEINKTISSSAKK